MFGAGGRAVRPRADSPRNTGPGCGLPGAGAWAAISLGHAMLRAGFSSRGVSEIQLFKGFPFMTPQNSTNKLAGVCGL